MTRDVRLAFAHPFERSTATAAQLRDRISVRDLVMEVEIGAFQAERGVLQRVQFNVVVEVAGQGDDLGDDVDRILSYDKVTEAIAAQLTDERINLLETLGERVAERILLEPQARRVFVRIEKLDRGPGNLGVEIVRDRPVAAPVRALEDTPHPHCAFCGKRRVRAAKAVAECRAGAGSSCDFMRWTARYPPDPGPSYDATTAD